MAIALADTDILIELAALDLLGEFLSAFELAREDVYVLPSEIRKLESQELIEEYGKDTSNRAVLFTRGAGKVARFDKATYFPLIKVTGIDPGEAVLFSALREIGADIIATGDGRALRALASASATGAIVARLEGKIVCFE